MVKRVPQVWKPKVCVLKKLAFRGGAPVMTYSKLGERLERACVFDSFFQCQVRDCILQVMEQDGWRALDGGISPEKNKTFPFVKGFVRWFYMVFTWFLRWFYMVFRWLFDGFTWFDSLVLYGFYWKNTTSFPSWPQAKALCHSSNGQAGA